MLENKKAMWVRKIIARKLLTELSYDLAKMLESELSTKKIFNSVTKRLSRVEDNKWQRVDWS